MCPPLSSIHLPAHDRQIFTTSAIFLHSVLLGPIPHESAWLAATLLPWRGAGAGSGVERQGGGRVLEEMGAGNHFNINRRSTEIEVIMDFNFDYTAGIMV